MRTGGQLASAEKRIDDAAKNVASIVSDDDRDGDGKPDTAEAPAAAPGPGAGKGAKPPGAGSDKDGTKSSEHAK